MRTVREDMLDQTAERIVMSYLDGDSYDTLAARYGVSDGVIDRLLCRGHRGVLTIVDKKKAVLLDRLYSILEKRGPIGFQFGHCVICDGYVGLGPIADGLHENCIWDEVAKLYENQAQKP